MIDDPIIKVLPSVKPRLYWLLGCIYVSYGYLSIASDGCLMAGMYHELGHRDNLGINYVMYAFSVLFSVLYLFLIFNGTSFILLLLFILIGYIFICQIKRLDEYQADQYAFVNTDLDSMREFLFDEGSRIDTSLSMYLYPFRWHPSVNRRYKAVVNYANKC